MPKKDEMEKIAGRPVNFVVQPADVGMMAFVEGKSEGIIGSGLDELFR